jgi:hypothetical protein
MSSTVVTGPVKSTASRREIPTPDYLSTIPDGAQVVVPAPVECYPEWTTDRHRFDGKPPTFPETISLPNLLEQPAYYAAAVDTIWLTNMRLEAHALYHPDVLMKPILDEFVEKWRETHIDTAVFPYPPDPQTLHVLEKERPSEEGGARLWNRACKKYRQLKKLDLAGKGVRGHDRKSYLRKSRHDIEKKHG